MKSILLTQGLAALVDDADYDTLSQFKWHVHKDTNSAYAQRNAWIDGKRTTVRMHRELLGNAAAGLDVDHRDRNGLNNQRCNLRTCTRGENARNKKMRKDNVAGLKGVSIHKACALNPYSAQIYANGTRKSLGCFPTAELAHAAYCAAAIELHGEFARFA